MKFDIICILGRYYYIYRSMYKYEYLFLNFFFQEEDGIRYWSVTGVQTCALPILFEQIERLIETSGLECTFLRPGMFAANALSWWAQQIMAGDVVRWPHRSAPTAPIDERDIAAVAVRALCEDEHAGAEYVLTGPESLSQFEQVSTIGGVIGRSLRIEEISPDEARRELLRIGPLPAVNMLLDAWAAAIGQPAHVTSTVAEITGAQAKTFLEWATDNAAEFQNKQEIVVRVD